MNPRSLLEQFLHPFECYAILRETAPVSYTPQIQTWEVFRYDDVLRVTTDHETFSSGSLLRKSGPDQDSKRVDMSIAVTDPPRHRQLRALVTQAFTPRIVAQLAPRIQTIINELIDQVATKGTLDVVDDLAYPLPITVIAELLGVPLEERERFKRSSTVLVSGSYADFLPENYEQYTQRLWEAAEEMHVLFREIIAQRRKEPKADLITSLITSQIDGESLNEKDLLGFCVLLLVAGNETTTNLITNAMFCFQEHPAIMEQLTQHPELLPNAIEEVLRSRSPVKSLFRMAKEDITIGNHQIKKGQRVIAWVGAANQDTSQFPQAERFDIHRNPNRHLAFGHGIHFCLGAPLTRLETKIALQAMLERLPQMRLTEQITLEPLESTIANSLKHLPMTFTPA